MIEKLVNYVKDNDLKIKYSNNSLNINNYDKILEVKSDVITISKDNSFIFVRGNDLKLSKLLDDEILITGIIKKIEL